MPQPHEDPNEDQTPAHGELRPAARWWKLLVEPKTRWREKLTDLLGKENILLKILIVIAMSLLTIASLLRLAQYAWRLQFPEITGAVLVWYGGFIQGVAEPFIPTALMVAGWLRIFLIIDPPTGQVWTHILVLFGLYVLRDIALDLKRGRFIRAALTAPICLPIVLTTAVVIGGAPGLSTIQAVFVLTLGFASYEFLRQLHGSLARYNPDSSETYFKRLRGFCTRFVVSRLSTGALVIAIWAVVEAPNSERSTAAAALAYVFLLAVKNVMDGFWHALDTTAKKKKDASDARLWAEFRKLQTPQLGVAVLAIMLTATGVGIIAVGGLLP